MCFMAPNAVLVNDFKELRRLDVLLLLDNIDTDVDSLWLMLSSAVMAQLLM